MGGDVQRLVLAGRQAVTHGRAPPKPPGGGRTWWAHFEFTRINIEPIILRKKIEDLRDVGTLMSIAS